MITRITVKSNPQISVTELGYLSRGNSETFKTGFIDCLNLANYYQSCSALIAQISANKELDPLMLFAEIFPDYDIRKTEYSRNKITYSCNGVTLTTEL